MAAHNPEQAAFTPLQKSAWAGFLRTHSVITRSLSTALTEEHGLTINEFEVLLCLSGNDQLRLSDLAARVNLTPSGMTGIVNRLTRRGLVARCTCPGDARAGYLELTQAGTDLFNIACDGHVRRVQSWFLAHFTDNEQRTLAELWTRFEARSDSSAQNTTDT